MNYTEMSLEELKDYAKSLGIRVGNIGKDKLIEKIKEHEAQEDAVKAVMNDDDDLEATPTPSPIVEVDKTEVGDSLVDSISSAIDELDEAEEGYVDRSADNLPLDTLIPVKSITFGGLIYKSRTNNAMFRWNQIGAVEYMTVADLNEMNNYKRDFLNRPLVILCDERAVKHFRLTPVYENVAKINNLKKVFSSDMATIERTIDNALAVNMRDILISKVSQMIKNKNLTDINIINLLKSKLHYDFDEMVG